MATVDINTAGAIELTRKGEAYALAHAGRREIEAEIERLIAILDQWDNDPDLEPSLGSPERFPSNCWGGIDTWCSQAAWADGTGDETEDVNEDGGDVNDEPHDANTSEDCEDDEPSLAHPHGSYIFGGGSGI